jgi:hypothetical protein
MLRPVTVGAAAGSGFGVAFSTLYQFGKLISNLDPAPAPTGCPRTPRDSPLLEDFLDFDVSGLGADLGLDLRSLIIGLGVGLTFGPIIDALFLLRRSWGRFVRAAIRGRAEAPRPEHLPPLHRLARQ